MGVAVWVCKESGGFSEKGRDTDTKREKEERKKHTENKKIICKWSGKKNRIFDVWCIIKWGDKS